jgi:uncharacterized protein YcbK (DUF882 family)
MSIDWDLYPNFEKAEFDCQQTGENEMKPEALALLQAIRDQFGPMTVTSGYRSQDHILEKVKAYPGSHAAGLAADIACGSSADRYRLVKIALECGAAGIGIHNKFIHIDAGHPHARRPALWRY